MVSKILLIVLISCTAVFASPIDRNEASNQPTEVLPALLESLKNIFGKLLGKIFSEIVDSLKKLFIELQKRLDTEEFRSAVEELETIVKVIYNEKEELKGDEETKQIIQKQLEKIGEIFQDMLGKALEYVYKGTDKKVDGTEFKKAVDELKQLVDKLYH